MSWASLANNQTVSFNNLQNAVNTGVFTLKTSIPASNEQITKADANTYVYINTGYSPYSAKASNQLVVKSDLQAAATYTVTPYASWGNSTSNYDYSFYYFIDSGPENYIGLVTGDSCVQFSNILVPQGSTIYFSLRSSTSAGDNVYYEASNSSTCPSNTATYCSFCDTPYSLTPSGNTSVACTVYIDSGTSNPSFCC
jgi:hypothetical protein